MIGDLCYKDNTGQIRRPEGNRVDGACRGQGGRVKQPERQEVPLKVCATGIDLEEREI